VLSSITNRPVSELLSIRNDERFLAACNVAASDAFATREYITMTNSAPTTAVKTTVTVPPTPWETKVLIVTALPEEMAAVLATMNDYENIGVADDSTIYRRGTYSLANGTQRSVVTATLSDMGKTNAATITANALRSFPKVEHVLMVGIAGGCPNPAKPDEHVRLGDIVVSDHHGIFEYDDVKLREKTVERRGSPQIPGNSLLQALVALKTDAALGKRPWEATIDAALALLAKGDDPYDRPDPATDVLHAGEAIIVHPLDSRRRAGRPRVFGGGVATGDALVKDPALRDELRDKYDARAIEMEGSAVRTASWAQGKDAIIVRGISDYCDGHKNDVWRFSAALAAAAYARALVETLPKEWFA
jgi:nucleoside phosphorylase